MAIVTAEEWQVFLSEHPESHILQSGEWGALKADYGWTPYYFVQGETGGLVMFRQLPLGFTIAYMPKGPIGADLGVLMPEIDLLCKEKKAILLKIEPDAWEGESNWVKRLAALKFRPSPQTIQPRSTISISLTGTEDEILARMKQKTRYNIRLAGKKDVVVKSSEDVSAFTEMVDVTGARDGFGVHTPEYYQRAYELFHPQGTCELLIAEYEGQPLAGVMVFKSGKRAWYLYGASTNQERNRMPAYLVQWAAMQWAKAKGCLDYDLWGVPDENEETLEKEFMSRHDGLWGVYRFKRGFGGELKRAVGTWDKVYNPIMYFAYKIFLAGRGSE